MSNLRASFINDLDHLTKLPDSTVLLNLTTYEQTILVTLEDFDIEPDIAKAPKTLKDIVYQMKNMKGNFQFKARHMNRDLENAKKTFFLDNCKLVLVCHCYYLITCYLSCIIYCMQT